MIFLTLLLGCERLESAGDLVDDFGDTTVAQAIFLGADLPMGMELPEDSEVYTSFCKVFLAEVSDASDVANAPLSGAEVSFMSGANGRLQFDEEEAGEYRLYSHDGLEYEVGDDVVVRFNAGGEDGELRAKAPAAPEFTLQGAEVAQEPLTVKLESDQFTNVVAAVYDIDNNILTWDNLPDDLSEAAELNGPDADPVRQLVIPGEAFRRGAYYAVGVAGLVSSDAEQFEGANRALSTFATGRLAIQFIDIEGVNTPK